MAVTIRISGLATLVVVTASCGAETLSHTNRTASPAPGEAGADALRNHAWKHRPLVVFSAAADDPRLIEQRRRVTASRAGFDERDMVLVEVVGTDHQGLRERYDVGEAAFAAVLVGKDTRVKLQRDVPIATAELFRLIDQMPMRRQEREARSQRDEGQAVERVVSFGMRHHAFRSIDDRVMGGVSRSQMGRTAGGTAVFRGNLSVERNGGFASVRATGLGLDLSGFETLVLRVRGDGKRYKLRLHDDGRFDGIAHQVAFDTTAGQWLELHLPLDDFRPVWRGRVVDGAAALARDRVDAVGLLISDKQVGSFSLEIDWLAAR